jgi:hypothetical protein
MITTRVYKPDHQRSKIIDGKQYVMFLVDARDGFRVVAEMLRLVLPVVAVVLDDNSEDIRLEESDFFSKIAAHICLNLDAENLVQIVDKMFDGMYCGNDRMESWGTHFAGQYYSLIKVLEWTLRENFAADFIAAFKERGLEIHTLKAMFLQKAIGNNSSKKELTETQQ